MINKRLLKLIEGNKRYLVYIILLNIFLFVLSISISALICYSLSLFSIDKNNETVIFNIIIAIFLAIIIRFILSNILNSIIQKFGSKILISLRSNFFKKLLKIKEFQNNEAIQLALEGIEQLNLYFTIYIPQFFYALISPILLFILFLFIDYVVALIFLISIPLIPLSIVLVSKYAKKIFNIYWDKYLKMGGSFLDTLKGLKELKLFKVEDIKGKELDKNNEEFRRVTMKVLVMQLFSTTIMDLVAYGGSAIGISVGIIHYSQGYLINSPFLLLFIILVGAEFFLPLRSLGSAFHMAMNGETAGIKLLDIIEKNEMNNGNNLINKISSISFNNVDFKYEDGEEILLNNINLRLETNNIYGICGLSGSGKSSFTKLILKEEEPFKGEIIFNNNLNLNDINNESYFDKLSYISYDSYLFNRSIFDNFKLYKDDVTKEEIYSALKRVRLSYLIDNNGYDYIIKEDASNLSGGEKQRLVLALHLLKKKDLYIFDEATSNIDKESEEIIKNIIYSLKNESIILFISHTLDNIFDADKIIFIDENKVNFDTFNGLIAKNSRYKELYKESITRLKEINEF